MNDPVTELCSTIDSLRPENDPNKLVAFEVSYDGFSGQVVFCDYAATSPNAFAYDGQLEQDVQRAFKNPNRIITVKSNMSQFVCRIQTIPKPLKKLFFKTTKHTIKITPKITMQMLMDHNLDYDSLVEEIARCPLYVRHRCLV